MALLGPDGERVELDGTWTEAPGGSGMSWWIRTQGSCVWGSGHVPVIEPFNPHHVQSFDGQLGDDFVITGDILFLGPRPPGAPRNLPPHAPLRMLIDFDEAGGLVLREDRDPGVAGAHCPDPTSYCPPPLVLQRAD
jgi:hypothetical protein